MEQSSDSHLNLNPCSFLHAKIFSITPFLFIIFRYLRSPTAVLMPSESSNLIRLIRSLKPGEKRYITLELSRYRKENNLLKLYQLIGNTHSVTDAVIRQKIKDKKFLSQLSINKHKLYISILDTLQQLYLKSSPYAQAVSMIHQAHLLFSKGLRKAQEELLAKAIIPVTRYEFRELHLQVMNLQQRIQNYDAEKTVLEMQRLCNQLLNERKLNQLHNRMLTFEKEPGIRLNSVQKAELKSLMEEALKIEGNSFTVNYYRFRISFSYSAITGDHLLSFNHAQTLLNLFKQFPHMLDLEFWRIEYIESLRNFIPAFTFFGKSEWREFVYKEAKRLDVPDIYKASIIINILDAYIQSGEYYENEKKLTDIQRQIGYYKEYLSPYNRPILYFNLALLNFGIQKFSKALSWLNEIINNPDSDSINKTLSAMTRILRLIVFYELGHMDLLDNNLRSTQRHIAKQGSFYQIDRLLLKFIRKIANVNRQEERMLLLKQTRTALMKLLRDKTESRTLDFFDFVSWIDCKIEQRSFAETAKQKYRTRTFRQHSH